MDLAPVDAVDIVDLTGAPDYPLARVTGALVEEIASAWRLLPATLIEPRPEPREARWGIRSLTNGAVLDGVVAVEQAANDDAVGRQL